jgi:hypothetical protein
MSNVEVTFINAGDNAELDAELDENQTADQVIQALITERFIPPLRDASRYYMLTIKGRSTIAEGQSLADAGVRSGDQIRVNVAQRGGV